MIERGFNYKRPHYRITKHIRLVIRPQDSLMLFIINYTFFSIYFISFIAKNLLI